MVLLGPQPALQISPPPVEELLGRGIESEERPLLRRQLLSADRSWVEHLHEPGEGSRAGRRDAQRPVASRAQLPRRVPAKTDRTSSWQFGRLPEKSPDAICARLVSIALTAPTSDHEMANPSTRARTMAATANPMTTHRARTNASWLVSTLATMSASAWLVSRSSRSASGVACASCSSRPSATRPPGARHRSDEKGSILIDGRLKTYKSEPPAKILGGLRRGRGHRTNLCKTRTRPRRDLSVTWPSRALSPSLTRALGGLRWRASASSRRRIQAAPIEEGRASPMSDGRRSSSSHRP